MTHRPEETLCTALLFLHRYQRWNAENQPEKDVNLDQHVLPTLFKPNKQLVSLASVSLASKATEHPRRMREILVPAYQFALSIHEC